MSNHYSIKAKLFFAILALGILILIAYANTLFSPFNFDDQAILKDLGSSTYPIWPVNYRHFIYYSFSLNKTFSGLNTFSYHLTNILFHFMTSVTVLLIAFRTFKNKSGWQGNKTLGLATTAAFLFALNPLHAEALTYISGRPSLMGAFFYLLALFFFILGSERKRSSLTATLFYLLSLLALSSALLSKSTALTFPVSVILYSLCFIKKENWRSSKIRLFYTYLVFTVLIVVFFITTFMAHLEKGQYIIPVEKTQTETKGLIDQTETKGLIDQTETKGLIDQTETKGLIDQTETKGLIDQTETKGLNDAIINRDCIVEKNINDKSSKTTEPLRDLSAINSLPDKNVPHTLTRLTAVKAWFGKLNNNYAIAQARVLSYALKLSLFPINLTFDYDFPDNWMLKVFLNYIPVAIWLVIIFGVVMSRISPMVTFALLWFLLILSPTNSFLPRTDLLSERNLYLSSFGFTFLIAYVFYHWFFFLEPIILPSKKGLVLLMTLFLILGSLLITRNSDYRSNIHLWEDTHKKSPSNLKVLHNLSHFYLEDKRYQEALAPLLRLSRSNASDFYRAFAHSNLGSIYTQNGNFDLAKEEFQRGIELEPTLPLGYLNLGTYYASRGEFRQARVEFLRARERYITYRWGYPMPVELDLNLARVNLNLKCFAEAVKYVQQYVQEVPGSLEGLLLLGKIYQEAGIMGLAEKTYRKIQGSGLASAKAHNNLGILYITQNQYEKAQDAFNSSINFYPQIPDAHYNLGKLILDFNGDHTLARMHLEAALTYNQSPSLKQEIIQLLERTHSP
jgi:tetratricopeptide (TPR) repeat protein